MRLVVFLLPVMLFAVCAHAQELCETGVHFPAGRSDATLTGTIRGHGFVDYTLGAGAGQRIGNGFVTSNASSHFNVLPGDGKTAIFNGAINGNYYNDVLLNNVDYRMRAYLMRHAARRNETADYTLSVTIHGNPAQAKSAAPPDFADGLSGGPDFWEVHAVPQNDALNVHAAPSVTAPIAKAVQNGAILKNLGCQMVGGQRWCRITQADGDGVTGWVAGRFLRETAAPSQQNQPAGGDDPATTGFATAEEEKACLDAVRATANNTVVVLDSEAADTHTVVVIGVGTQRAPWKCLVSQGRVSEVMSMTDEGAL